MNSTAFHAIMQQPAASYVTRLGGFAVVCLEGTNDRSHSEWKRPAGTKVGGEC